MCCQPHREGCTSSWQSYLPVSSHIFRLSLSRQDHSLWVTVEHMTFCFCYQLLDSKPLTTEIGYAAHAFVSAIHVVSSSRSIASAKFLSTHLIYISTTISSPSKQRHSDMRSRRSSKCAHATRVGYASPAYLILLSLGGISARTAREYSFADQVNSHST